MQTRGTVPGAEPRHALIKALIHPVPDISVDRISTDAPERRSREPACPVRDWHSGRGFFVAYFEFAISGPTLIGTRKTPFRAGATLGTGPWKYASPEHWRAQPDYVFALINSVHFGTRSPGCYPKPVTVAPIKTILIELERSLAAEVPHAQS